MSLTVQVENESGETLGRVRAHSNYSIVDASNTLVLLAQSCVGPIRLLRYVDPYGDTVFNHVQMPDLIADLEAVLVVASSVSDHEVIEGVLQLARFVASERHMYLKFYGD